MSKLQILDDRLWKGASWILYALMWLIFGSILLQVFNRMVLKSPSINWPEEVSRYAMVWLCYVAIAMMYRKGSHLSMQLIGQIGPAVKNFTRWFSIISSLAFSAFLLWWGFSLIEQLWSYGQKSPALLLPMWIAYAAIPVGAFLNILGVFLEIKEKLTGTDQKREEISF